MGITALWCKFNRNLSVGVGFSLSQNEKNAMFKNILTYLLYLMKQDITKHVSVGAIHVTLPNGLAEFCTHLGISIYLKNQSNDKAAYVGTVAINLYSITTL